MTGDALACGKKIQVPFDQLIIFSTNLDPKELVDEAFLRRIKYKIEVSNPTEDSYRNIFRRVCEVQGVPYVDQAVTYLIEHYYKPRNMALRACHPRDLVMLVRDAARYRQIAPALSKELLGRVNQGATNTLSAFLLRDNQCGESSNRSRTVEDRCDVKGQQTYNVAAARCDKSFLFCDVECF